MSLRRFLPAAALFFFLGACALAEDALRLDAGDISTWREASVRLFVLTGKPSISGPGGALSAESMVVRFDEGRARGGRIELEVYSESADAGTVTVLSSAAGLAVDDRALRSLTAPPETPLVNRARAAFSERAAAIAAAAETPAVPASEASPDPVTGTAEAPSSSSTDSALAAETPSGESPIPGLKLPEGESVITYSPIDADYYEREMERIGNTTRIVIIGGIEIALGEYRMRAGNMVIYVNEDDGGKVKDVQIYAEDNVQFFTPSGTLEAGRLYYDSADNSAILIGAELRAQLTLASQETLPLVLKADKVRSYAGMVYRAQGGYATTCEFGRPHYRLASSTASVIPLKHPDGTDSALLVARNNRFYVGRVPALAWPRMSRDIKDTHTPLRRIKVGNSDEFGTYVYTSWDLFDFLGGDTDQSWVARASQWSDLVGALDYRGKRGTGSGLNYEYSRGDVSGAFDGYYIKDRGRDTNTAVSSPVPDQYPTLVETPFQPPSDDRGRLWWRQRAFYDDWQIDAELNYISDRGFLAEYYEREFKEAKVPETYIYAKRPWEHAQAAFLYRPRINDFQTQDEYLPQAGLAFAGYPLFGGRVVYNSSTLADNVRYRPDSALGLPSYQTQRFDTKHEFELPLPTDSGFTVTPFASVRGSAWNDDARGDSTDRFAGSAGAKVALPPVWRVYDVTSSLLNVDRLRHVVNFDVTYEDIYDSTRRPTDLLDFDEVEAVQEGKIATFDLRQRLQTKRDPAVKGGPQRTVNLVTLDVEADYFPDSIPDDGSRLWSDVRYNGRTALTDDVSLIADGDYDTYDSTFDTAGLWFRVDHSPRTTFSVGYRNIRTVSSSVVSASVDHVITDRWQTSVITQYDFQNGQTLDDRLIITRKVHEFAVEFDIKYDKGRGETSVGIGVYPLVAGGVRRF